MNGRHAGIHQHHFSSHGGEATTTADVLFPADLPLVGEMDTILEIGSDVGLLFNAFAVSSCCDSKYSRDQLVERGVRLAASCWRR